MERVVIFEGKTTMGGMDVDLRIYKVNEDNGKFCYYQWDYNPHLVDKNQMGVHIGDINLGHTLEDILYQINSYKKEIREIKDIKPNNNF
jgi:hypothetical protein